MDKRGVGEEQPTSILGGLSAGESNGIIRSVSHVARSLRRSQIACLSSLAHGSQHPPRNMAGGQTSGTWSRLFCQPRCAGTGQDAPIGAAKATTNHQGPNRKANSRNSCKKSPISRSVEENRGENLVKKQGRVGLLLDVCWPVPSTLPLRSKHKHGQNPTCRATAPAMMPQVQFLMSHRQYK